MRLILALVLLAMPAYAGWGGSRSQAEATASYSDEDRKNAAASAASISIAPCTNGASGQGFGGGGSLGLSDPYCKVVASIYVAQALCTAAPMVPIECGGGGEDHPDLDVTTGVENIEWVVGVHEIDELVDTCRIVNPACGDVQLLWDEAKQMLKAETGAGGWRAKVGAWLPNFLRWLF